MDAPVDLRGREQRVGHVVVELGEDLPEVGRQLCDCHLEVESDVPKAADNIHRLNLAAAVGTVVDLLLDHVGQVERRE